MKLKRLLLKNIRSYEEAELFFPDGSFLLSGDVGSGKTSILSAIEYAFFGLQPGQKGSALLRNQAELGEVTLEFEVENQEIRIERRLKRSKKTVVNDSASITINGNSFSSSLTEIKTKILELLGYPAEFIRKNNLLYRYTVYTPQEQMKNIILEEPETRLNLIGHIFGIDKYKRIRVNALLLIAYLKEESKKLESDLGGAEQLLITLSALNEKISGLNTSILAHSNRYNEAHSEMNKIRAESTELELKLREKDILSKEIEKTEFLINTKVEALSALSRDKSAIAKQLSESRLTFKESEYQTNLSELIKQQDLLENLRTNLTHISAQIISADKEIAQNLSKKERIFNIIFCPTCLQNVEHNHRYNIINDAEKNIVIQKKQKEQLSTQESLIRAQISQKLALISSLQSAIKSQESQLSKHKFFEVLSSSLAEKEKQENSLSLDITLLEQHRTELKSQVFNFSKFEAHYSLKQKELKEKEQEERKAEISLAEIKKEKELSEVELFKQEQFLKEKEVTRAKLQKLRELQDWFENSFLSLIGFIERSVLLRLREEFSKFFSKWFQMLISEQSLDVRLDENFTPVILQGDIEMDYSFLSGGERTAIALAYRLSLNQILNSLFGKIKTRDIIILDEPTEGFSEAQLERIRDVFIELNAGQLIIVSHEQKVEGFVSNVLKLKKNLGLSFVDSAAVNRKT